MPGVIFDSGAVADFLHHLNIVHRAGLETLGFEELALAAELREALLQLGLYAAYGGDDSILGHDVVLGGVYEDLVFRGENLSGNRVYVANLVDFIAEELDSDCE